MSSCCVKALCAPFSSFMRRLYEKTLELSAHKHALCYLALISFAESSFFPLPPDLLLIPMVLAAPNKAFRIALVCTLASVIGGYGGYAIGALFYDTVAEPVLSFYGYAEKFDHFRELYNMHGAWIVFGAGVTPFPYKVITIASGVTALDPIVFGVASVLARAFRFYLVATLLWKFGAPMKSFIEKNLGILSTLFFVLLVGSFALLKLL